MLTSGLLSAVAAGAVTVTGALKARSAPQSALISVRLKKLEAELAAAKAARAASLETRKSILLHGSDEALAKHDNEAEAAIDRLARKIADAEYMVPVLKEEMRIATEHERKAALEEHREVMRVDAQRRIDAFNKKLGGDIAKAMAMLAEVAREERDLFDLVGEVNRDLPAGAEPLDPPGRAVRYSPGSKGVRKSRQVTKSRVKNPNDLHRPGGADSYEKYQETEEFVVGEKPAFDPPPLWRTMEIPALRDGDPSYRVPYGQKV